MTGLAALLFVYLFSVVFLTFIETGFGSREEQRTREELKTNHSHHHMWHTQHKTRVEMYSFTYWLLDAQFHWNPLVAIDLRSVCFVAYLCSQYTLLAFRTNQISSSLIWFDDYISILPAECRSNYLLWKKRKQQQTSERWCSNVQQRQQQQKLHLAQLFLIPIQSMLSLQMLRLSLSHIRAHMLDITRIVRFRWFAFIFLLLSKEEKK